MLEFIVRREIFTDRRTLGRMYFGGTCICDTLEDTDRHLETVGGGAKVYSKTAIPRGRYKTSWYYWAKFRNYYPLLLNVPYFSGILIHGGVTEEHTSGCVLVGTRTPSGTLSDSSSAMAKIRRIYRENVGKEIWITVE